MRNKKLNYNRQIMMGVMVLAVAVLVVVMAFWVWCFPDGTAGRVPVARYTVFLSNDFVGDSTQVYLNDSLAFDGEVAASGFSLPVAGRGTEDVLMVADVSSDEIYTFALEPGRPYVYVEKKGGELKIRQEASRQEVSMPETSKK